MEHIKKKKIVILLIVLVLLVITGTSYALWQLTLKQTGTNVVTTDCFKVEFKDKNPITLENSYPTSDNDAIKLLPYEFTITNTCNSYASYQINLEILDNSTLEDLSIIKFSLNESSDEATSKFLTENEIVTPTLNDAITSYQLKIGYLNHNESKTYNLRLWMDGDTPALEKYMSKTMDSKVTITTSYVSELPESVANQVREYIISKSSSDSIVLDDETRDHNLRYIGKDPNNYIDIGDRDADGNVILWRVIGLMNNIGKSDTTSVLETRLKIVRAYSIGGYSWDTTYQNGDNAANRGFGINEWSQADLMKLLNPGYESETVGGSLYWNSLEGTCYDGDSMRTTACNFTSSGLSETAKNYIGDAIWNTGAVSNEVNGLLTSDFYEGERSNNTGKICTGGEVCNDVIERHTTWFGKVGLIYPSDYGFATNGNNLSGSTALDRNGCLNSALIGNWNICGSLNWLNNEQNVFTLTPAMNSLRSVQVFLVSNVNSVYESSCYNVKPAVYLKSNVKITGGEGSISSPFTIGLADY